MKILFSPIYYVFSSLENSEFQWAYSIGDKLCSQFNESTIVCQFAEDNIVTKTHKQIKLRILGDGPKLKHLKNLTQELNLNSYITFEGLIANSEVNKYYKNAHLFVSMSKSESWGQMYIEAMASGLAIISAKNVGSESIIKEEFGYLIEQENYKALAEKIIFLIQNPNKLAKMSQKARVEVEKYYDWDRVIIPKYFEVYKKII